MRVCQWYAVGSSCKGLLAYDEYDSGSGSYYTDDLLMCNRYTASEAVEEAKKTDNNVYLVTITKNYEELPFDEQIITTHEQKISLMWDRKDIENKETIS